MAIQFHPQMGTILICDFGGFIEPEMVKRRTVVVISPRFRNRNDLCTIVPLSTTDPDPPMDYHYRLKMEVPLPPPYTSEYKWVKGDMLATVSFNRLSRPCIGKDSKGKRQYLDVVVKDEYLRCIRECVLHGLALSHLTKYL